MPPILNAQNVSKRFGVTPLFENLSFTVSEGDRIGLIGPNGAGKSTLLAVLASDTEPDTGNLSVRKRARIGYVRQVSEFDKGATVRGVLEASLVEGGVPDNEHEQRIRETMGRSGFEDGSVEASSLSGGWKKRLAIAEAAVRQPDVMLLDEPTNHLDVEGIEWLEGMLKEAPYACVVVTHDRYFLENAANEVVELSRVYADGMLRVRGTYSKFLEAREAYMEAQQRSQEGLRNRVKTEIEWLRRGPKARATKAKARIDNAHGLIGKLAEVDARMRTTSATLSFDTTDRQTKRLIEFDDVTLALGGRDIVRGVKFSIANGMKLGLVGPNGSGKTTILRAITGDLAPTAGTIKRAASLRIVYFSQMRELDEKLTLRRALAPDSDGVVYQGNVVHVASYAAKFLFSGDQLNQPVERLSGGERARVLLARLMLQPADVLILDEPTNDLDIPTLEILEESLLEFNGALVLVTHDRYLLDRVSNVVLGLDGKTNAQLFADYMQWEEWKQTAGIGEKTVEKSKPASEAPAKSGGKKKLSYMEQREFDGIEAKVDAADTRMAAAHDALADPAVTSNAEKLTAALAEMEAAQAEHDAVYERWAELTEKAG